MNTLRFFLSIFFTLVCLSCGNNTAEQDQRVYSNVTPPLQEKVEPSWKIHFDDATKLGGEGKYSEAITEMKKALEIRSSSGATPGDIGTDLSAYNYMGNWHGALNEYEQQATSYRKMTELDPADYGAHYLLARVLVQKLHRYDEGLKEYELFRKNNLHYEINEYSEGLRAEAYEGLGDKKKALKYYKIFLKSLSGAPLSEEYKNAERKIEALEGAN